MHFVINVFVAGVCFISLILFKEIFNKIMKVLLSVVGCGTLSYALSILIKNVVNGLGVGLETLNIFLVISYGSYQSFLLFILLFVLSLQRKIKLKSKLYFFIPTAFLQVHRLLHYNNLHYVLKPFENRYQYFSSLPVWFLHSFAFVPYLLSINLLPTFQYLHNHSKYK